MIEGIWQAVSVNLNWERMQYGKKAILRDRAEDQPVAVPIGQTKSPVHITPRPLPIQLRDCLRSARRTASWRPTSTTTATTTNRLSDKIPTRLIAPFGKICANQNRDNTVRLDIQIYTADLSSVDLDDAPRKK